MKMKKFKNGRYTVVAKGCLSTPFEIEIRTCHDGADDCYFVKFPGFDPEIMTEDEILSEIKFLS